jgi:hypothetical protein
MTAHPFAFTTSVLPALVGALLLTIACGGNGDSPAAPSAPPGQPGQPTITLGPQGANPRQLRIETGQRVLFVNNDTRPREPASNPHPDHFDCPPINEVGILNPGQSRQTGTLTRVGTCGFHDHLTDNTDPNFRGVILVGTDTVGGPPDY